MLPKLISIGSFFIPTYGTLVALGFLAALWIIIRLAKRSGLASEPITNLAIYCALAGLAGAKLFMILFDFKMYWHDRGALFSLATLQAAGVYQGGFVVAFITAILYTSRQNLPILRTCDIFAPGIALGQAIGRVGCLSAGCCWGIKTHLPWAITFHNPQAAQLTGVPLEIPLHPTQLYESIADALIFLFLYFQIAKTHAAGTILGWYLALYSSARFVIEFFRFHEQGLHFGLSYTQWISLATLVAGIALLSFPIFRSPQVAASMGKVSSGTRPQAAPDRPLRPTAR
ncbi:MAG: prolipoprotein diacylglyceryl transferase [Bryobacterales bacterium]|nr:prolipoprotein diacylglyceryl transferase [Bryobacterales bacterium]